MEDGSLELKGYAFLFGRWWWIFVLSVVVALAAAYYITISTTPLYQSVVKIVVERHELPGVPSLTDVAVSQNLAENYVDLIETRPVLAEVAQRLPVSYGSQHL